MQDPVGNSKAWLRPLFALAVLGALSWGAGLSLGSGGRGLSGLEECGIRIAGSSVLASTVMPDITAAFMRDSGYNTIEAPSPTKDGVAIVGRRGDVRCTIEIASSTAVDGFAELASGEAKIALSGRPMHDRDVSKLLAAGAGDFAAERTLSEHVIAADAVVAVVHRSNPLREISTDIIRDIALGAVQTFSWQNGTRARISLLLPKEGNRPDDFPNDSVTTRHPAFENIAQRATLFFPDSAVFKTLNADPNALSIVSMATLPPEGSFKVLSMRAGTMAHQPSLETLRNRTYPLIRRMFLYARPDAARSDPFVRRFLAFAESPAAAPLFEKHMLVPWSQLRNDVAAGHGRPRCLLGTPEAAAVEAAIANAQPFDQPLRFDGESTALDKSSADRLRAAASQMATLVRRGGSIILIGHSDAIGDPVSNRASALRRAVAVRTALEALGVFGAIIESAGEMCHIAENVTEAGRRQNRRVEVWLRRPASAGPGPAQTTTPRGQP